METAVISDIHGNLEALDAVLYDVDLRKIKRVVCLGDITNYGASPNECVARIRDRSIQCVIGNHDKAVLNPNLGFNFNDVANAALTFTRRQLGDKEREFLQGLDFVLQKDDFVFTHGSIIQPENFRYLLPPDYGEEGTSFREANLRFILNNIALLKEKQKLFVGHSHMPFILHRDGKTICNVGSVGQPRDKDNRACYAIFNEGIELVRVDYDVEVAAHKIECAGLPYILAERLFSGI